MAAGLLARTAEEWEHSVAQSFVPLQVDRIAAGFQGSIAERSLDSGLRLSRVRCGGSELRRTERSARADTDPVLLFVSHHRGAATVAQAGRTAQQVPGQSVLYRTDRPYELQFPSDIEEQVLAVPLRLLATGTRDLEQIVARSLDESPTIRVLRSCLHELTAHPSSDEPGLARVATELVDLVITSWLGQHRGLSEDALVQSVKQFIDEHATDPALDPEAISAAFHISRRTLYAALKRSDTTPAELLRHSRMTHAARLLRSGTGTIESVAHRAGFTDVRTLTRVFRAEFGTTPHAYRTPVTTPAPTTRDRG